MTDTQQKRTTILEAIETIVTYLWNDELFDYEASHRSGDHIFRCLEILNRWTHAVRRGEQPFES